MKIRFILIALYFSLPFFWTGTAVFSQSDLDSLWSVWKDESKADTLRFEAITNFIRDEDQNLTADSTLYYAQLAYDFAESKGLKIEMTNALIIQTRTVYLNGEYAKALDLANQNLTICNEIGYKKGSSRALIFMGMAYDKLGNYFQALSCYFKCIKINEEIGDVKGLSMCYNNAGNILSAQGNYSKALIYFQKSLKIKEELGYIDGIISSLTGIGNIYYYQDEFDKALDYYKRSLKLSEEIGSLDGIATSTGDIGTIYSKKGNFSEALAYYLRSLDVSEEDDSKLNMAVALNYIGNAYKAMGDFDKALEYYRKGLEISKGGSNQLGMANSFNNIGRLYMAEKMNSQALLYCKKGLKITEEIGVLEEQKVACECLYDTYKSMGKSAEALVFIEQIQMINDHLDAEETTKKLQQMEFTKFVLQDSIATVEKERLIQLAHEEELRKEEKSRNIGYAAAFLFLLMAGGFFSRWRYIRRSKAVLQVEKDRSEDLLLNILPEEIAQELKIYGKAEARDFDLVSILFTDFKGFTEASAKMSAGDLVSEINFCFEAFDGIMEKYGIEKIKTIGDAYMAAGGLPVPTDASVKNTVLAALEMQAFISKRKTANDEADKPAFEMRVGIHTGPVVAGIVGVKKFQYDIWGDTVNTASRIESNGQAGKVNISQATYELLKDDPDFTFESRGKIEAKGKGEMEMYFVSLTT